MNKKELAEQILEKHFINGEIGKTFVYITDKQKLIAAIIEAMGEKLEVTPVMIECPECETIQAAIIERTIPFGTYIHHCENCKYTIMESEWKEVKPFKAEAMGVQPGMSEVVSFLRKKIATNSRKWDRAQTTSDKIKYGGKARMCREILDYVLSVVMNADNQKEAIEPKGECPAAQEGHS